MSTEKVRAGRRIMKAARVFLLMEQSELAAAARVSNPTLSAFELGKVKPQQLTRLAIQDALEARGIVFTNGGKPGFYFDRDRVRVPVSNSPEMDDADERE